MASQEETAPDYDYEAWRKATGQSSLPAGQHYPDTYKLPNHMTFSSDSIYSNDKTPGGKWIMQGDKWHFYPSAYNLQVHTPDELAAYFAKVEPNAVLHLPGVGVY